MSNKYRDYFEIDEEYFPQINDSSIAAAGPDFWLRTYPHQTFVEMLTKMERVLSRQEKRSLWIEGAYGTGKSQCAYALKRILEVPEADLRLYWDKYEPLRKKPDLLEKLLGHKNTGIVPAYRYASGSINSARDLFFAVQESVKAALLERRLYVGENTLKESVIAWIEKPPNKRWLNELLQNDYSAVFSQSNADEVLRALRKDGEVKSLMDNIFRLADKEGITALTIDADKLRAWLVDVIDTNGVKIVLIWDEFTDYFRSNRESLSEFQKIAELVSLRPFYFVIVTHESSHLVSTQDPTMMRVRDRFVSVNITLPDNIAFDLIGHAFNPKAAAMKDWDILADDLNSRVNASRSAVMKTARITDEKVMKDVMPLHPMSALLLKNIASAFKSNQRSMFDFIKTPDTEDVKAFQWFIEQHGPLDDHPLLTVDMLWNFFYEKGRDNLTSDIRLILDTFPQQHNLRDDAKAVLKAILIMQAIDQRLGGAVELFKATEQNLSYVFEGITSGLDVSCKNIAKGLKDKGILVSNPISGGRHAYAAAVLAGDQAKIESHKKEVRKSSSTAKLVTEGDLGTLLSLSPALRLRYEPEPNTGKITTITASDFTRNINVLRDKAPDWRFHAVIAFAKDEGEAATFRTSLKAAVAEKQYENIVFIDALSTPLGGEAFEQYVDYSAMAMYYNGNNNASARENSDKARRILDQDWKSRIYHGPFVVYTYNNQDGEKVGNAQGVASILQRIVTDRFRHVFDFAKGLTETQLRLTTPGPAALYGITQDGKGGVAGGLEKHVLSPVWKIPEYWKVHALTSLPISRIKIEIDKRVEEAFADEGQIAIGQVYDFLQETYGFAPCNLSAFLTGFLLKEYSGEPYRYSDHAGGHEAMTPEKLKEMSSNYIGKNPKPTYIVKMTAEERAFYELTEKAWDLPTESCYSVSQAVNTVHMRMRNFGLPIWCLAEVDDRGVFDVVQKYIELTQKEGREAHAMAVQIGRIAMNKPTLSENLAQLLTMDNCQKGMIAFLKSFEDGKIPVLAAQIGAAEGILADMKSLFSVKYSCLWERATGEDEIRRLLTDYGIAKKSNDLLGTHARSRMEAFKYWRERLQFLGISHELLQTRYPSLTRLIEALNRVYKQAELLPEQLKDFHGGLLEYNDNIRTLLRTDRDIFSELYASYLEGLSDADISEVKSKLPAGVFAMSRTESNIAVKKSAEDYRSSQLKTQLARAWKDKTGTSSPRAWSSRFRTPILCCVATGEFDDARRVFETLNRSAATDSEIRDALSYLERTTLFEKLANERARNEAFARQFLGSYRYILTDLDGVREALDKLAVDPYDWYGNPAVRSRIKGLAESEYQAGGSSRVESMVARMEGEALRDFVLKLIRENIAVGLEILAGGEKRDAD